VLAIGMALIAAAMNGWHAVSGVLVAVPAVLLAR
jgi:hypothetical protein